jgi:hypothetical protein
MSKRLPSLVLFIIAGALLIYTASQTLDLLKMFLPAEQAPLAYLALVAFDGGLLGWSFFFAKGARGSWQRSIAAIMIVVSIVAVVIGFAGETFFNASKKGMLTITPDMSATVVWAVCGVIAANVVAIVVTHLTSPEHRRSMAEEEANDVIEDAVIEAIKRSAPITARQIAPHKVTEWVEDRVQMYLPAGQTVQALPAPQPRQTAQPSELAQTVDAEPEEKKPSILQRAAKLFGAGEAKPEPATMSHEAPIQAEPEPSVRPASGLKRPLPNSRAASARRRYRSFIPAQPSRPSQARLNQKQADQ